MLALSLHHLQGISCPNFVQKPDDLASPLTIGLKMTLRVTIGTYVSKLSFFGTLLLSYKREVFPKKGTDGQTEGRTECNAQPNAASYSEWVAQENQ